MKQIFFFVILLFSTQIYAVTKIFSLNLQCFENEWEKRLDYITSFVAEIEPEIISLQEVCVVGNVDQRKRFLNLLELKTGQTWYAQSLYTHIAWDKYAEYLMVLTNKKPIAVRKEYLPSSYFKRGFIAVNLAGVWHVNVHLAFAESQARSRRNQIESLKNYFHKMPHILMGDFNSGPKDAEQALLLEAGYRSHFPKYSFPSDDLKFSFDGFWLSRGLKNRGGFLQTFFKGPYRGTYISDHLAVFLTLF